ncbi:MAG: DUF3781 domain-containing protein [Chitinophagales bacterium]|nr:DUF3781 domain-containing protein [Chitinophagales bacterium]
MNINKPEILNNIGYTELVYNRINKKLKSSYTRIQIEALIFQTIQDTPEKYFQKIGKNYYISNIEKNIKITVNSNTFSIITVDTITQN